MSRITPCAKHVFLLVSLLLITLHVFAAEDLFSLVQSASRHSMAPHASPALKSILENKAARQISLVNMAPSMVADTTDEIALPLEKEVTVVARKFQFEQTKQGISVWHGALPDRRTANRRAVNEVPLDAMNSVILARHGNNVTGSIRYQGQLYEIKPIGHGEHVIIKVDVNKIPHDRVIRSRQRDDHTPGNGQRSSLSIIRVMFVMTNQSSAAISDPEGKAALMIAFANAGFSNSDVHIQYENAGIFHVNYNEIVNGSAGWNAMFDKLENARDQALGAPVHQLREEHRADLVVMLIGGSTPYAGLANQQARKELAFCLVATDYMDDVTMAHETGHIIGTDHDPEIADNAIAYGHGYQQKKTRPYWHTVMAGYCQSCAELNYWSNPRLMYNGLPLGVEGISDNVRVLNERRDIVAGFYPPIEGERPTGQLDMPLEVDANQNFSVRVNASDPIGSTLSYAWSAPDFEPNYATTSSFNLKAPHVSSNTQKTISVEVTNIYGSTPLSKTITIKAGDVPPEGDCAPPWIAAKAYQVVSGAREKVSYDGYNYEVGHWTQGNPPDRSFTEKEGDYSKPWRRLGTCGAPQPGRPPVGTLDGNNTVDSGKAITFTANATSPDNRPLSYSWTRPTGFSGTIGNTRAVTLTAPTVTSNTNGTVNVSVSDGQGGTLPLSKTITVNAPVIAAPAAKIDGAATVEAGKPLPLSGAGSSGDNLRYAWLAAGFTPSSSTAVNPTFTAPGSAGSRSVTLTVTDAANRTASASHAVNVTAAANRPPVGALDGNDTVDSGKAITFTANATSPDNHPLSYSWTRPAGFSGTIGNTRAVTLTAPAVTSDANGTVNVVVSDGRGGSLPLAKQIMVKAPVQSGDCAPPWVASKVYAANNEKASYDGYNYEVAHWTQNNRPDLNYVITGSAKPWRRLNSCTQ
jgi:hypothetical protein